MQLDFPIRFDRNLDEIQCRVLGCMIEKELTTSDYYPITLNALTNACNQKSNRHPKMDLTESQVATAISALTDNALCMEKDSGRASKYAHKVDRVLGLDRAGKAILCELLVRGPQSPGELRTRCSRMAEFPESSSVEHRLKAMSESKPALVKQLPRQSGQRDQRWMQLMNPDQQQAESGHSTAQEAPRVDTPSTATESLPADLAQRVKDLEDRVAFLEDVLTGSEPDQS